MCSRRHIDTSQGSEDLLITKEGYAEPGARSLRNEMFPAGPAFFYRPGGGIFLPPGRPKAKSAPQLGGQRTALAVKRGGHLLPPGRPKAKSAPQLGGQRTARAVKRGGHLFPPGRPKAKSAPNLGAASRASGEAWGGYFFPPGRLNKKRPESERHAECEDQPPSFTVPVMMAQWPGKEQKKE
ncbi:hypothetical protein SAMN04488135_105213 [Pollutimonas bauzanensis]|uniref:Uncharacterized protein n=1 Tax=Pollutimonas bauzanensis TaxID=658167 RepID=A0A1M5WF13_9BURK|nr:hypothetical protein SAMN04488135_105213 [Pollutimonas bauzanensis]